MKNKGMSKPLWIIAIVLAIFLILVLIAALTPPPTPPTTVPPTVPAAEVAVTTGEVTDHYRETLMDHYRETSVKVTLEGEKDSYDLSMTGPEGLEVGGASITETQMADGIQSVWIPLVLMDEVAAKPGAYSLVVTNSSGNKVYEKTFGPYSGSDLSIINIKIPSAFYDEDRGGYYVKLVQLTCKNDGDLPAYVSKVNIKIDTKEENFYATPYDTEVILPGETDRITAEFNYLGSFDEGDYSASLKLKEGSWGEGKTVATYTKIISIP